MPLRNIPFQNVRVSSPFWSKVQQNVRDFTVPSIIKAQKEEGHWDCLTLKKGHQPQPHAFWDSDVYKTTEAACNLLLTDPNENMLRVVEETVEMIREAQHPDGYLNSFYTEANVAYEMLTKIGRLLEVVIKSMHHLDPVFGREEGKKRGYPDHQEIELGLLPKCFILERGTHNDNGETCFHHETFGHGADPYDGLGSEVKGWFHGPPDYAYNQADRPIREQTEIRGHAVRAMYYYTAVADLVRLEATSDPEVVECKQVLKRLWRDMVNWKMYVTGAVGVYRQTEGFGEAFVLNDLEMEGCYGETCASFTLIVWCQRILQIELRSDSDGEAFYYQNVLRNRTGQPKERERWFGVACCPPNVAKLVGSLGSLLYLTRPMILRVSWWFIFIIRVEGTTRLALRIPDWMQDQGYTCSLQGELEQSYLHITIVLVDTEVRLSPSTTAHQLYAHPRTDKDKVCLRRGPLVYCVEDVDNVGIDIDHIALEDERALKEGLPVSIATTHGVTPLLVTGRKLAYIGVMTGKPNRLHGPKAWEYEVEPLQLTAIPYFLRANRGGNGAMRVWTPRCKVR
ncbi:hypothetical protein BDP81DRAFT_483102 [Colletotrichum phormii]|uniref:Non-reducing end beta-L-arabinofuranosidase n=1 Tax=Colletotrichum phormii TaxID=359342 RepID=A0AAI9ZKR3_9PEZI|nr:uncharacterized protein BDP81DRAFT_483102 [Colletotrichum phormii]KAK1633480.1 hypothetical protein BDP81DRAFT_483102 [Colletotrichum phormii]